MRNPRGIAKPSLIILFIALSTLAILGIFAVLTYPRTVVSFPISFSIGADIERTDFEVPFLHERVQVQVTIQSGSSLWTAMILKEGETIWNHAAHQADQTSYQSEWIELPQGPYNFTFATAGFGSLEAEIRVVSKGSFW